MITVKTGVSQDAVKLAASHRLFVEGKFDKQVLFELLQTNDIPIEVEALGSGNKIGAVAEALYKYHQDYYFIIDRDDDYPDQEIEKRWGSFPDPNCNNLLIWKRRELENYFLIPEYICKSKYLNCSFEELKTSIVEIARRRIFLDAVNTVLMHCYHDLKKDNWVTPLKHSQEVKTKEEAIEKLETMNELKSRARSVGQRLRRDVLITRFEKTLLELNGGLDQLEFGCGLWLERLNGKEIWHYILHEKNLFRVKDKNGRFLGGDQREEAVIRDLIRNPIEDQPADLQQLCRLLKQKLESES